MPLRPSSPVQLVTRALRNVWSTYQTSAWCADRYRCMAASFGTYSAAAFTIGTGCAGWTGTGVLICETAERTGVSPAIPATVQSSGLQSSVRQKLRR